MKIFNIKDGERFFERVLSCTGAVYVTDRAGRTSDLKQMAEYFIASGMAAQMKGIDEMNLRVEKKEDMISLMRFAMQMDAEECVAKRARAIA